MMLTSLTSPLSVPECVARLEAARSEDDRSNLFGFFDTDRVRGTVGDRDFQLTYRSSLNRHGGSSLSGTFRSVGGVTTVDLQSSEPWPWLPLAITIIVALYAVLIALKGGLPNGLASGGFFWLIAQLIARYQRWVAQGEQDELMRFVTDAVRAGERVSIQLPNMRVVPGRCRECGAHHAGEEPACRVCGEPCAGEAPPRSTRAA